MGCAGSPRHIWSLFLHEKELGKRFVMPLYEYECQKCGSRPEVLAQMGDSPPVCCGAFMRRIYSGSVAIRDSHSLTGKRNELWIDRMDEIHKRQTDRGERLRFVHPSEVVN